MNPLVVKQLETINTRIADLRTVLKAQSAEIDKQRGDRERVQKELWGVRKDMTALKRVAEDYDELDAAHARCLEIRHSTREALERILKHVKMLSAEYHS